MVNRVAHLTTNRVVASTALRAWKLAGCLAMGRGRTKGFNSLCELTERSLFPVCSLSFLRCWDFLCHICLLCLLDRTLLAMVPPGGLDYSEIFLCDSMVI